MATLVGAMPGPVGHAGGRIAAPLSKGRIDQTPHSSHSLEQRPECLLDLGGSCCSPFCACRRLLALCWVRLTSLCIMLRTPRVTRALGSRVGHSQSECERNTRLFAPKPSLSKSVRLPFRRLQRRSLSVLVWFGPVGRALIAWREPISASIHPIAPVAISPPLPRPRKQSQAQMGEVG